MLLWSNFPFRFSSLCNVLFFVCILVLTALNNRLQQPLSTTVKHRFFNKARQYNAGVFSPLLEVIATLVCSANKWFTDYLFFRKQTVQYNGVLSEPKPVFTGVPQGSILGPLLFIIHFNDANKPLQSSRIITYDDDTFIFTPSRNFDDIERNLKNDINNLSTWFRKNELIVNLKKGKTESMIFGTAKRLNRLQGKQLNLMVNRLPINSTTSYKYLGVH